MVTQSHEGTQINMDKVSKTGAAGVDDYYALQAGAKYCARCGRTIFYRVKVNGQAFVVHGDKSVCAAGSLEP